MARRIAGIRPHQPSHRAGESERKPAWPTAAVSGFLGALVGGALAIAATWLTLDAQRDAQAALFAEQREAEARDRRADAYLSYAAALREMSTAENLYLTCGPGPKVETPPRGLLQEEGQSWPDAIAARDALDRRYQEALEQAMEATSAGEPSVCASRLLEVEQARLDLAGAEDVMEIYGSDAAMELVNQRDVEGLWWTGRAFQFVTCFDLSPVPRESCQAAVEEVLGEPVNR